MKRSPSPRRLAPLRTFSRIGSPWAAEERDSWSSVMAALVALRAVQRPGIGGGAGGISRSRALLPPRVDRNNRCACLLGRGGPTTDLIARGSRLSSSTSSSRHWRRPRHRLVAPPTAASPDPVAVGPRRSQGGVHPRPHAAPSPTALFFDYAPRPSFFFAHLGGAIRRVDAPARQSAPDS